jgi:hypothetical protein
VPIVMANPDDTYPYTDFHRFIVYTSLFAQKESDVTITSTQYYLPLN